MLINMKKIKKNQRDSNCINKELIFYEKNYYL